MVSQSASTQLNQSPASLIPRQLWVQHHFDSNIDWLACMKADLKELPALLATYSQGSTSNWEWDHKKHRIWNACAYGHPNINNETLNQIADTLDFSAHEKFMLMASYGKLDFLEFLIKEYSEKNYFNFLASWTPWGTTKPIMEAWGHSLLIIAVSNADLAFVNRMIELTEEYHCDIKQNMKEICRKAIQNGNVNMLDRVITLAQKNELHV